jgi:YgiT-type zinc finger domain-containing protein
LVAIKSKYIKAKYAMKCTICKNGTCRKGKVTVTMERKGAIVLLKDVPAQVCNNCGHYYLSTATATLVFQKSNEALQKGAELEVLRLPA